MKLRNPNRNPCLRGLVAGLTLLGFTTSCLADTEGYVLQFELGLGGKQARRDLYLSWQPGALDRTDSIPLRLPLYSTDRNAWTLMKFSASEESSDSNGQCGGACQLGQAVGGILAVAAVLAMVGYSIKGMDKNWDSLSYDYKYEPPQTKSEPGKKASTSSQGK